MKLVEINWHPSPRQLRQFGGICLVALPLIGWFWDASLPVLGILALMGLAVAVASWLIPQSVKLLFLGLSIVAIPIGLVVGELAMLAIFFLVFLPIGIVFQLLKRDALQVRFDRNSETYWQPKKQPKDVANYYRQF
jgi:hypothetical protein